MRFWPFVGFICVATAGFVLGRADLALFPQGKALDVHCGPAVKEALDAQAAQLPIKQVYCVGRYSSTADTCVFSRDQALLLCEKRHYDTCAINLLHVLSPADLEEEHP